MRKYIIFAAIMIWQAHYSPIAAQDGDLSLRSEITPSSVTWEIPESAKSSFRRGDFDAAKRAMWRAGCDETGKRCECRPTDNDTACLDFMSFEVQVYLGLEDTTGAWVEGSREYRIASRALSPAHPALIRAMLDAGEGEFLSGFLDEARGMLEKAELGLEARSEDMAALRIRLLRLRGKLQAAEGKYEAAKISLEDSLALAEKHYGRGHSADYAALLELGRLYLATENYRAAKSHLRRAGLIVYHIYPAYLDPRQTEYQILYGLSLTGNNDFDWARSRLENAVANARDNAARKKYEFSSSNVLQLTRALKALADLEEKLGRLGEAEALRSEAVGYELYYRRPDHPETARSLLALGKVYLAQSKLEWAHKAVARSRAIAAKSLPVQSSTRIDGDIALAEVVEQEAGSLAEIRTLLRSAEVGLETRNSEYLAFDKSAQNEVRRYKPLYEMQVQTAWKLAQSLNGASAQ